MILRRITQNVREQNWLVIGLIFLLWLLAFYRATLISGQYF